MTINDQMDRNDFRKDIPSHVIDDVRQDKVIMWFEEVVARQAVAARQLMQTGPPLDNPAPPAA